MAAPRCRNCGGLDWTDKPGSDEHGRCVACREFPTLGYSVVAWVDEWCVIPDREDAGQPFRATNDQCLILLNHWRVNPFASLEAGKWRGAFVHSRGSQVTKPQKWGKAPLSSVVGLAEAAPDGPVLFDGWDAEGQPVGRPWPTPHVQVTACSEDQTDNVFRALLPMIRLGPLAEVFQDNGLSRINTPTGGLIEPVTAAAISRLGQRVTCALQDQTESWLVSNGGHRLADNQRRGLAGTGGRFFETPNAWDPIQQSVAQLTYEAKSPGVFKTYQTPPAGSIRNKRERDKVLRHEYGDSVIERGGWIDIDRIHAEIEALLEHDPAQGERWFMNRCQASEGAAFDFERFKALHIPGVEVPRGSLIVIGVDGARHDDAFAMVATDIKTGYQWPLCILERPDDAGDEYEHDQRVADAAMVEAMERFQVWRVYIDPQYIEHLVEKWSNRYGPKRVVEWLTYRPRSIAFAVREYAQAIGSGDVHHDGNETFVRHVGNARKRMLTVKDDKERLMHTLSKDSVRSPRKIDAAMAALVSWKARSDAVELGVVSLDPEARDPLTEPDRSRWVPGTAPALGALTGAGVEVGPMGGMF
jgi:hypothetical protein